MDTAEHLPSSPPPQTIPLSLSLPPVHLVVVVLDKEAILRPLIGGQRLVLDLGGVIGGQLAAVELVHSRAAVLKPNACGSSGSISISSGVSISEGISGSAQAAD